jgi:hypothetical protein
MKRNVGTSDRWFRGIAALVLLTCSMMAPLPARLRLPLFGLWGLYMLFTAASGTCLIYTLTGKSTCPARFGEHRG